MSNVVCFALVRSVCSCNVCFGSAGAFQCPSVLCGILALLGLICTWAFVAESLSVI